MGKNLEKIVLGLACTGAVVGALCLYSKNHSSKRQLEEDFRVFTDEFENGSSQGNYTDIPYTANTEA